MTYSCTRAALRLVLALALSTTLVSPAFSLAPTSRYASTTDEAILQRAQTDAWLSRIVAILHEQGKEKAGPDKAQERLSAIRDKINQYMASQDSYITWKNVFTGADQTDYFDFVIAQERHCFALTRNHLADVDVIALENALPSAVATLKVAKFTRQSSRQERDLLEYSDILLQEAISEGRFFAIRDLLHTDFGPFFSGSTEDIARKFVAQINISDAEKKIVLPRMITMLSESDNAKHVREMFKKLRKSVIALEKSGAKGLEQRQFTLVLGNGPTPLMYVRTEEGEAVNVLAHAGKRHNSIYFGLEAAEEYATQPQALAAVIRTENAFLQGEDDMLSPTERKLLARLVEKHIAQHVLAKKKEFDKLEVQLVAAIAELKQNSESEKTIKKSVARRIHKVLSPTTPVQWHLIGQKDGKSQFLFSAAGRRFYVEYDPVSRRATSQFANLKTLYELVAKAVGAVIPSAEEAKNLGNTWEDLLAKFVHLSMEYKDRLRRHGRGDVANLLDYVRSLDHSSGYLDDILWLTNQLEAIKTPGNVPPVFVEKPLPDLEYTLVHTLFKDGKKDAPGDFLEISALRFRGMRVVGKFHEFVHLAPSRKQDLLRYARLHGIEDDHAFDGAASKEDVLARFKAFIGTGPIFTHGNLAKVEDLRRHVDGGLNNQVVDTVALAKKVASKMFSGEPNYGLPALCRLMGVETPQKKIRGMRLLRMVQHVVHELALIAKQKDDAKSLHSHYTRLLDRFIPIRDPQIEENFKKADATFPGKFMRVNSWAEIKGAIAFTNPNHPDGIQMLVLDFDETIEASKGWVGSDAWYRAEVRLKELYGGTFFELLDRFNKFLTRLSFFELMDPRIPEVIREAQNKGIEVVVLTARGPWEGHDELLHKALKKMDIHIPISNIVLTGAMDGSGNVFKKEGLIKFCNRPAMRKKFNGNFPRMMYVDDGEHYLEKMANDRSLEPFIKKLVWYLSDMPLMQYKPYSYYIGAAEKTLKRDPQDTDVLGYLLNAFFVAYERNSTSETLEVGNQVLALLGRFKGPAPEREEAKEFIRDRIREDPELRGALLLHEIYKAAPGNLVIFRDTIARIEKAWGNLGFTSDDERYISQDSRLLANRDARVEHAPITNALIGVKIVAWRAALPVVLPTSAPVAIPGLGTQSKRGYDGGTIGRRNYILTRLGAIFPLPASLQNQIGNAGHQQIRDLADCITLLGYDSTPEHCLTVLQSFFATQAYSYPADALEPAEFGMAA